MDISGNFRRFILARVYITICCENAVDITIISADEHNALMITFGDDIANSAEFDATPILALIVSTEEDHDQLRPVAIDALEKCIQRWPSQLGNIVVIIGAACKTLIDSERRKNTQASSDVGARQLARF